MSALGYFLELAGIATTGISLVRENTASMRPPRALWVSFPLGRPLGVPGDALFQHGVIAAALALLDAPVGPVLVDYPIDVPSAPERAPFCSVPLTLPSDVGDLVAAIQAERSLLLPWYQRFVEARGRTTVGLSSLDEASQWQLLRQALDALPVQPEPVRALTLVLADLEATYLEAAAAMPSAVVSGDALRDWLYEDTRLGELLLQFQQRYAQHDNIAARGIARAIAPRRTAAGESQ